MSKELSYADRGSVLAGADQGEDATLLLSNTVNLVTATRGIYVGVTGNVKVDLLKAGTVTFVGLAAGVIHPIRAKRIYVTGTTATSVVVIY